jgi:hypothetical protein
MPSPSDFKKAFKLNKGAAIHSPETENTILAEVQKATIGHTPKKRNELYEFPSTLNVEIKDPDTTESDLEAAIKHYLSEEFTVYSAYGSPYLCSIVLQISLVQRATKCSIPSKIYVKLCTHSLKTCSFLIFMPISHTSVPAPPEPQRL